MEMGSRAHGSAVVVCVAVTYSLGSPTLAGNVSAYLRYNHGCGCMYLESRSRNDYDEYTESAVMYCNHSTSFSRPPVNIVSCAIERERHDR